MFQSLILGDAFSCGFAVRIGIVATELLERFTFGGQTRNLGISQRMLSLALRELQRDRLVNRTYHPTISPKVE